MKLNYWYNNTPPQTYKYFLNKHIVPFKDYNLNMDLHELLETVMIDNELEEEDEVNSYKFLCEIIDFLIKKGIISENKLTTEDDFIHLKNTLEEFMKEETPKRSETYENIKTAWENRYSFKEWE